MTMKRFFYILLAALLLLTLAACAKTPAAELTTEPAGEAPDWQTQYDLGVRYLSEGNYEEAIIAFTAAIEIDPKQPDTYKQLAEAYYALGEDEKARDILRQGYEATGDDSLNLEEAENELTEDELAMTEDLWISLANHDMEQSHSILSSEELISLIMRIGVPSNSVGNRVYPDMYMTLGSLDSGMIIAYDPSQVFPVITCIFGQWKFVGHIEGGGAVYYPQGDCVYYESWPVSNSYMFTVAQFEDGLPNGSCEENIIQFSGAELSSITTTTGETTYGLWNGVVTTRDQWVQSNIRLDETGESEFVDGVPKFLGYIETGSDKVPCYSRNLKTGELLTTSSAGAFKYVGHNMLPCPYRSLTQGNVGESDPYEFAKSNMRLSVFLPFVWEEG